MNLYLRVTNKSSLIKVKCSNDSVLKNLATFSKNKFVTTNNNDIIIETNFFQKIHDVIRYKYKFQHNLFIPYTLRKSIQHSKYGERKLKFTNSVTRKIIIVLESPHVKEYTSNMIAISPAQGRTGKLIHKNILKLLKKLNTLVGFSEDEILEIILINPIPFQTSLSTIHKKKLKGPYKTLRDNVWKSLWNNTNLNQKFEKKLKKFSDNDIIINACTASLKEPVRQAISVTSNQNKNIFESFHPSAPRNWVSTLKKI